MSEPLPPAVHSIKTKVLVPGTASGSLLVADTGLSFWGGVDPLSGDVIDQHHPLFGHNINGCVLAIPSGRGSCSGSGALLELILNGCAPAALIFTEAEDILTLGVMVAEALFNHTLPVVRINRADFSALESGHAAAINHDQLVLAPLDIELPVPAARVNNNTNSSLELTTVDLAALNGEYGAAVAIAMKVILHIAEIQGAKTLIDVSQAHIDACIYHGPSSLHFAQKLQELDAKFKIPTTLNAISVDDRNWKQHGIDNAVGQPASDLGHAYMHMGAEISYTCAPYLLDTAPQFGDQIVWAESNAVMFANSVIGARTQKYPDFLDVFIALTGKAPASGSHLDAGRQPTVCIAVELLHSLDESLWPLLGYTIGLHASNDIPFITGLEHTQPGLDDLKAFSAAFATTGSSSMFHLAGITPEAVGAKHYCDQTGMLNSAIKISRGELLTSYHELNSATSPVVDAVCLGNPHFSLSECEKLAALCKGRTKHADTKIMVTMGRAVYENATKAGLISSLEGFGVQFITDTCWCMIVDPLIPPEAKTLMTNSGKYAHYGPALVNRGIYFDTLAACVDAACNGTHKSNIPDWLREAD